MDTRYPDMKTEKELKKLEQRIAAEYKKQRGKCVKRRRTIS